MAEILKNLGDAYFEAGQYDDALQEYLEQIEACKEINNQLDCAIAHRMVGEIHSNLGNYQEALFHQNQHLGNLPNAPNIYFDYKIPNNF